jgi:SAM-dependent methyltransferase
MSSSKLQITQVDNQPVLPQSDAPRMATRRQEIQATMERLWLTDPEQFNPMRDCVQRKRVERTTEAIRSLPGLKDKRAVDLGCGSGVITRHVRDCGMKVVAVDAATKALDRLGEGDMERITPMQDCLPATRLDDAAYDLVVCTEVIGFVKPAEYRLFFAELARLVTNTGHVVCSSSLDVNSDGALEKFATLAETEFAIDAWILSYDLLWNKLCAFFDAPENYFKASRDPEKRRQELDKRRSLGRAWFNLHTTRLPGLFWGAISSVSSPIAKWIKQMPFLMRFLEKITQVFWNEAGVSQAIFVGKRRPMTYPLPKSKLPQEIKHKRQVWE